MGLTRLGEAWEAPVNIQLAWFAAAIYIQEGGRGTSQGITRNTGGMKEGARLPDGSWSTMVFAEGQSAVGAPFTREQRRLAEGSFIIPGLLGRGWWLGTHPRLSLLPKTSML